MNIKLYLNRPEDNKTSVMAYITFNSKRIRCTTGVSIEPKYWNSKNQRIISSAINVSKLNTKLQNFKSMVEEAHANAEVLKIRNVKEFMLQKIEEHKSDAEKKDKKKKKDLLQYYDLFVKDRANDKNNFSDGIIKNYNSTRRRLADFKGKTKKAIMLEDVDNGFYVNFTKFLSAVPMTDVGVGKHIKTFKTFMNYCVYKGYTQNIEFRKFKVFKMEPDTVALTLDELDSISSLDYTENKTLDKSRDLFLAQCYTGLRFSDLAQISEENINFKQKVISITTQKTKEKILIPIPERLEMIIKKYGKELPKVNHIVHNRLIKQIAFEAGLTEIVAKKEFYKGKLVTTKLEKWQLCASHTAKRTSVTILLRKGALPEMVMKVIGNKDRKNFQRYVRIAQNEAVESIRNIWDEVK